jgi:hypothetical protein
MKSWKTTVTSIISAIGAFVLFSQFGGYYNFPKIVLGFAVFMQAGGLAAFGIVAKDSNVTGGTVGQPSTPQALIQSNTAASKVNPPQLHMV